MLKYKLNLFLSFLFVFSLFLENAYSKEYVSIYGHNFQVNEFLDLGDNVQISVFQEDNTIIPKDELNFYVLKELSKDMDKNIFEVCDDNCLFEIFERSLEKKDFKTSAFAIYFLAEKDKEGNNEEKILDEISALSKKDQEEVLKGIFENKEIYKKENENLAKYFVLLSLLDNEWVLNNAIRFLERNENFVIENYNEKILQLLQNDGTTLKDLEQILKSSKNLLGVSNEFCLKLEKNLDVLRQVLFELNSLKRGNDFKRFDIKKYENFDFIEFIKREYIKKVYALEEKYINEKDFENALNVLVYIPYEKRSQKTYDLLTYIFDNAVYSTKLLDSDNIEKILAFAKENQWLLEKVIKFQEDKIKFLIFKKDKENSLLEFDNLLLLRKDNNFSNDRLRLKLANMLLSIEDKENASKVLGEIKNKSTLFLTLNGLCIIFKVYIYNLFLIIMVILLLYFLVTQIRKIVSPKTKKDEKSKEHSKDQDGKSDVEYKEYLSNLEYFGIKTKTPTEKEVKSAYRTKIKLIHPDIIGYESQEFLNTQQRYNNLLKFINKNK